MSRDQDQLDRLPPHNREAERSLLGSMLRDNAIIGEIVGLARPKDFYIYGHEKIYEAITKLNDDGGKPADIVTVAEFLTQAKQMDEIGGPGNLAELWDAAPSASHFHQYAEIVRQQAILRNLIHACTDPQAEAFNQSRPALELIDHSERRILQIADTGVAGETRAAAETVQETYAALDARRHGNNAGIPSGFADLDALTAGFRPGELVILAARPSVGKTAFAVNIARHVAIEETVPTLFVSLEQSRVELTERLFCCQGLIDSHRLKQARLRRDEEDRFFASGDAISQAPLWINDDGDQGIPQIASNARRMKRRAGVGLVLIDYLQLIEPADRRAIRQEQVADMSRRLKRLARELRIPIIVAAQLNREAENRADGRPKLSDLRESGAIEQDADLVILLHRPVDERGNSEGIIEAIVAKHRNGPTGAAPLLYVKQYMRFESYANTR